MEQKNNPIKKVIIDIPQFMQIKDPITRKIFVESKLKDAGFDMTKYILSVVDTDNMKYIYIQDENNNGKKGMK
jgi:hypothetical protein